MASRTSGSPQISRSFRSAGLLLIGAAAVSLYFAPKGSISPIGWGLAGLLVIAGLGLIVNPKLARIPALGATALVTASGVLAALGHPEASIPGSPMMTIFVGAVLCARILLAQVLAKSLEQPSVNDDDDDTTTASS